MAVFFTYNLTSYEVTGVYPTQALANTEAGKVAADGAYAGSTDIDDVQPDGNWFHFAEAPIVRPQPRIQLPVRRAFQTWHNRGIQLSELLLHFSPIDYPQWALNLAHDTLHAYHVFGYVLYHWDAVPNADKLRALQMAALGPKDLYPSDYAVESLRGTQRYDRDRPESIFPIMTDVWEAADSGERDEMREIGTRPLSAVGITIETNGDVTLVRNDLTTMLTDEESPIQGRPTPSLTMLDGCSYINSINA